MPSLVWPIGTALAALALSGLSLLFPSLGRWPIFTAFAIIPVGGVVSVLRLRRNVRRFVRAGGWMCAACAFDLRGLEPHGKCPECGTEYTIPSGQ